MKKKHRGSTLDEFLKEEGMLEEIDAVIAKRIFVFQISKSAWLAETMDAAELGTGGRR